MLRCTNKFKDTFWIYDDDLKSEQILKFDEIKELTKSGVEIRDLYLSDSKIVKALMLSDKVVANGYTYVNTDRGISLLSVPVYNAIEIASFVSILSAFWLDNWKHFSEDKMFEEEVTVAGGLGLKDLSSMFNGCGFIRKLDLSDFKPVGVRSFKSMFSNCIHLESIDLSHFDFSCAVDLSLMFNNCVSLKSVKFSDLSSDTIEDVIKIFSNCFSLEKLDLHTFVGKNLFDASEAFSTCTNLKEIDLSNFHSEVNTNINYVFFGSKNLSKIKVSGKVIDNTSS